FKKSVTLYHKPKRSATKLRWADEWRTRNIFNDVGESAGSKQSPNWCDQVNMVVAVHMPGYCVCLARRRSMDRVELPQVERRPERVALDKTKRIAWLWANIDADHVEPRTVVADGATARTAEQV